MPSTDPKENPAKSSARSWLENAKGLLLFLGIIAGILFFTRIIVRIVLTIWNVIAGFFGGIAAGVLDALDHIDLATWYFGQGQAQIRRTVYECFGNPDTVDDCKWWNIGAENGVYLWNQLMAHQSARIIFGFVFPAIILTLIKKIVDEIWEATKKPAPKD